MNYKLKQDLPKEGKMQVIPEESETLQRALFDMGYRWWASLSQNIKHVEYKYLYWDTGKEISFSFSEAEEYFNNQYNPLCLFEDYFETNN